MACEFRYPDADDPLYSYTPPDPLIGSKDGSIPGLEYHRTADGELVGNVQHPRRRRFVRDFRAITYAQKAERDAFFDATRGLPFLYIDETLDDYVTVKAVGRSVGGDEEWDSTEGDLWARTEELEETSDMPNLTDLPGDTRAGSITIEDTDAEGTVTFGTPYLDANYLVLSVQAFLSSSGIPIAAWPDLSSLAASGFTVKLQMPPGDGESVRVDYLAAHL
jgi:hypothetical protein